MAVIPKIDLSAELNHGDQVTVDHRIRNEPAGDRVGGEEEEVAFEQLAGHIGVCDVAFNRNELDVWIDASDEPGSDLGFAPTPPCVPSGRPNDPGKVVPLDGVEVDPDDAPDAEVRQLLDNDRAAATKADDSDGHAMQKALPVRAEHACLAVVALVHAARASGWVCCEAAGRWPGDVDCPERAPLSVALPDFASGGLAAEGDASYRAAADDVDQVRECAAVAV